MLVPRRPEIVKRPTLILPEHGVYCPPRRIAPCRHASFPQPNMQGGHSVGGLLSVEIFDTATSETNQFVMPAGVADDDICVVFNYANSSSTPSLVTPSGFSNLDDYAVGGISCRTAIHYKVLAGTEGGNAFSCMAGNEDLMIWAYVFRPSRAATPAFSTAQHELTNGNPSAQSIAMATAGVLPVIGMAAMGGNTGSNVFSTEPTWDNSYQLGTGDSGYLIKNPGDTPANESVDCGDTGFTTWLGSIYMTLT